MPKRQVFGLNEVITTISKARRATHLTRICIEDTDVIVETQGADGDDPDMHAALLDVLDQAYDALELAHAYISQPSKGKHTTKGGA